MLTKPQIRYLLRCIAANETRSGGYSDNPFVSNIEARLSAMLQTARHEPGPRMDVEVAVSHRLVVKEES